MSRTIPGLVVAVLDGGGDVEQFVAHLSAHLAAENRLTPTQTVALGHYALGLSYVQIAARMGCSERNRSRPGVEAVSNHTRQGIDTGARS